MSEADQIDLNVPRNRHLFGPGPKRMLCLDGGGVRGAISIAFLARLEKLLTEIEGKPVRLCDWFDLIGGTSTGAIIATALALGHSVSEILDFYEKFGPKVFRRSWTRITGVSAAFDAEALREQLEAVVGTRTLGSEDLLTGLCIMTKRMDTGSAWTIINNPRSKYWKSKDGSFIDNSDYLLANIVRASTAAPSYFDPELISIVEGQEPGVFLDGALTPHNNPALGMFMAAVMPQFELNWPIGADNLMIMSIGTGAYRYKMDAKSSSSRSWPIPLAINSLRAQASDSHELVMTLMSWLGDCDTRWVINSEIGDVSGAVPPFGLPMFRFLRYDLGLDDAWLRKHLGVELSPVLLEDYRSLDNAANIPPLYALGEQAAAKQMERAHLIDRHAKDATSRGQR